MGQKLLHPIVNGKKQCGECGEWFDLNYFTKYKEKYYSSRCKKCLNEYAKKYRDNPKNKKAKKIYHENYMNDISNREKKNKYIRDYRKIDYVKEKTVEANRNWKKNEKQKAADYKGGECSVCGYRRCLTALEFHHTNPKEKDGYNSHWTFEKNKLELDKCILLCANCHREIHAKEIWYEQKT